MLLQMANFHSILWFSSIPLCVCVCVCVCVLYTPSNNTRNNSTHGHHQMVNTEIRLILFFAAKDGEALYNRPKKKKKDWELTVAQIMNSLLPNWRKKGKITRPFSYHLNQTPYNYIVEVINRVKELVLIECLKNCRGRFVTLYRRQWSKPSPRKRNAKGQKEEALQIAEKRKVKGKGEKEIYPCRGDKKAFLSDHCKEIEENNRMGKTRSFQEN